MQGIKKAILHESLHQMRMRSYQPLPHCLQGLQQTTYQGDEMNNLHAFILLFILLLVISAIAGIFGVVNVEGFYL